MNILYFDQFISNKYLPDTYILNWIFISSPIFQILLFSFGYFSNLIRLTKRFITMKDNVFYSDMWRGKKEMTDFILFLIFTSYFFIFLFLNTSFYNGWRLVYFFNFFIIYFAIYYVNFLLNIFKRNKFIRKSIIIFTLFAVGYNSVALISYHPFQSVYFNSLLSSKTVKGFEGDYHGISAKHFFKKIASLDNKKIIKIGVASFTPLQRGLEGISPNLKSRFDVVGQEYQLADYIYKNNISDVNSKLNKKYEVPKNFSKIYELKINKTLIYEIYKIK